VDTVDSVRVAGEQKKEEEERKSNTVVHLDMTTTLTATDPWMLFLYALKAPALLSGTLGTLWLYWTATFIGSSAIAFLIRRKFKNAKTK
jgi:hypothetical protein